MSPVEYRTILKYRLIIPLFPKDEVFPICRKVCLEYKHDLIRDVLFDIFRYAGISAKKDASMDFLIDQKEGRSTLSSTNVLVYGSVGK
jgi:hypothetical protein